LGVFYIDKEIIILFNISTAIITVLRTVTDKKGTTICGWHIYL